MYRVSLVISIWLGLVCWVPAQETNAEKPGLVVPGLKFKLPALKEVRGYDEHKMDTFFEHLEDLGGREALFALNAYLKELRPSNSPPDPARDALAERMEELYKDIAYGLRNDLRQARRERLIGSGKAVEAIREELDIGEGITAEALNRAFDLARSPASRAVIDSLGSVGQAVASGFPIPGLKKAEPTFEDTAQGRIWSALSEHVPELAHALRAGGARIRIVPPDSRNAEGFVPDGAIAVAENGNIYVNRKLFEERIKAMGADSPEEGLRLAAMRLVPTIEHEADHVLRFKELENDPRIRIAFPLAVFQDERLALTRQARRHLSLSENEEYREHRDEDQFMNALLMSGYSVEGIEGVNEVAKMAYSHAFNIGDTDDTDLQREINKALVEQALKGLEETEAVALASLELEDDPDSAEARRLREELVDTRRVASKYRAAHEFLSDDSRDKHGKTRYDYMAEFYDERTLQAEKIWVLEHLPLSAASKNLVKYGTLLRRAMSLASAEELAPHRETARVLAPGLTQSLESARPEDIETDRLVAFDLVLEAAGQRPGNGLKEAYLRHSAVLIAAARAVAEAPDSVDLYKEEETFAEIDRIVADALRLAKPWGAALDRDLREIEGLKKQLHERNLERFRDDSKRQYEEFRARFPR